MSKPTAYVGDFGGGIVRSCSAESRRTNELQACDGYDLTDHGLLVPASAPTNFATATQGNIYNTTAAPYDRFPRLIVVGGAAGTPAAISLLTPDAGAETLLTPFVGVQPNGYLVTVIPLPPAVFTGVSVARYNPILVNIGPRQGGTPRSGFGLYVVNYDAGAANYEAVGINQYMALGTGARTPGVAGTLAVPLFFKGIHAYADHAWGWGFDSTDATNGDGPARLMFSNAGNPYKWGFDADPTSTADRSFTDTDAINIGDAGTIMRGAYNWQGRMWVGTNRELHYVTGYGRESFQTNGSVAMRRTSSVIGPHAMTEGPDGFLYGVSSKGLWRFDGSSDEPVWRRLVDPAGRSNGYWDLIWTDTSRAAGYPGTTNEDLVWLLSDPDTMTVWVVIPFCSASNGYGYGTDTVVIRYNVVTGGFTRQVFAAQTLSHGCWFPAGAGQARTLFVAQPSAATNIARYAHRTAGAAPALPSPLPTVTSGEYALYGPESQGPFAHALLTLSWQSASSLPLAFTITPTVDGQAQTAVLLTIGATQPVGPSNGDLWVDTSGTDTNLGNGTAGTIVTANAADFILRRYVTSWAKWVAVPGMGQQGTRVSVPIALTELAGTRASLTIATTSAAGRYQIEGLAPI